jgi:hypothetical protein
MLEWMKDWRNGGIEMMQMQLPIGIEDFKEMITGGYFYIDKTDFIRELLDQKSKVNLFTRPRRFGKSLNMSMLQYFFEKKEHMEPELFCDLNIINAGREYTDEMNKYPVISISLKGVVGDNFDAASYQFKNTLNYEFSRHRYLLEDDLLNEEMKEKYKKLLREESELNVFSDSLKFLSKCLQLHYQEKVLILIDEYDVPLESAYFNGYYKEMISFVRLLFGNALKTNPFLSFAVLTGCLRVSKESIFTGLNNIDVNSIISNYYGEYFGFTEAEVKTTLVKFQLEDKYEEMKSWYNGYNFGKANVYNPWSVIQYLKDIRFNKSSHPEPYWSNTSSNRIVHELIEIADEKTRIEIESLIRGNSIEKPVFSDMVYSEIKENIVNLWNFLFFTGYLRKIGERFEDDQRILTFRIPNKEVLYIYKRKIREWFHEKIKVKDTTALIHAILSNDTKMITTELNQRLMDLISFHDSAENFYHGFLTAILGSLSGFQVKSNREAGKGRSDIFMKSTGLKKIAVIFECKVLKDNEEPEKKCEEALNQIEEKNYAYDLIEEGYKIILNYAVVFRGKECLIAAGQKH